MPGRAVRAPNIFKLDLESVVTAIVRESDAITFHKVRVTSTVRGRSMRTYCAARRIFFPTSLPLPSTIYPESNEIQKLCQEPRLSRAC